METATLENAPGAPVIAAPATGKKPGRPARSPGNLDGKKALYHSAPGAAHPTEVIVVKTHSDGRVDLSRDGGETVLVKRCQVSEKVVEGHCTIGADLPEAEPEKS